MEWVYRRLVVDMGRAQMMRIHSHVGCCLLELSGRLSGKLWRRSRLRKAIVMDFENTSVILVPGV